MNINSTLDAVFESLQEGNLKKALDVCERILKKKPDNVDALNILGTIYFQLNQSDLAISSFRKAVQIDPNYAEAWNNLGNIFQLINRFDEAVSCYQKAVQLNPDLEQTYVNLGIVLQDVGRLDEAIPCYQKAISLNPRLYGAYNNLGLALQDKGHIDEAIRCYQNAVKINPDFAEAYYNFGNALKEKQHLDQALALYEKAIQIHPRYAEAYNNLGIIFREKGQLDEAIASYQRALHLNPKFAEAYSNLANALHEKGEEDETVIACCKKALEINPDLDGAYALLTYQIQRTCNWQELSAMTAKLDGLTGKALDAGGKPSETPFMSIIRHDDPAVNFAVAKLWSHDISKSMADPKGHFSFDFRRKGKTKITIGYLSNDFGNHATSHLMLSLFGLHNRDDFKIFCYSYGKDDGSSYRARIQSDCDKFVDVASLNHDTAAKCIYDNEVDILIDLKGYTRGNRLPICALQPAPIQVSYLGFPGTTGADFFDYIITDRIVTPPDAVTYYSEEFVYLPHCYQVNDYTQSISNKKRTKEAVGLPENSFVLCSFNNPYKIDPVMFDIWMSILQQIPESVLWLLLINRTAEDNLRREAEARGVKSERLIFAESLPKDEHLARLVFADLALDTRIVNGHTTTSDALWAGVPVITLQGSHFASRVSSSILSAIGFTELITHSLEEYESLAVKLARNPVELQEIRQRIEKSRLVAPLFDTPRFVRNLERAYKEMWKIFLAGEAPRQIDVKEG
jgi:protein O-GlcNAc transferase